MQKYRLCTTISMKHYGLLRKHLDMYETQGKVLEQALESLDRSARPDAGRQDEKGLKSPVNDQAAGPIQKYALMMLLDTLDLEKTTEYIARVKPAAYALEYIYRKPLKECSLKEIMDGLVITSRATGWYDTVECTDSGDRYVLKIAHSLGENGSRVAGMVTGAVFDAYGVAVETVLSDKGIVQTIYKNKAPVI